MLTDQEGLVAGGAEAGDVGGAVDAALADQDGAGGHVSGEGERRVESDFEGGEIAVVDTDDIGAGIDGGIEFAAVMNFDEGAETERGSGLAEIAELAGGEDGGDEKDG